MSIYHEIFISSIIFCVSFTYQVTYLWCNCYSIEWWRLRIKLLSSQTRMYKINIGCSNFSSKHATVRCKRKDWLARKQNNVSTYRLLFQWTNRRQSALVLYKANIIIISLKCILCSPWYKWINCSLGAMQQSLTYAEI